MRRAAGVWRRDRRWCTLRTGCAESSRRGAARWIHIGSRRTLCSGYSLSSKITSSILPAATSALNTLSILPMDGCRTFLCQCGKISSRGTDLMVFPLSCVLISGEQLGLQWSFACSSQTRVRKFLLIFPYSMLEPIL